MTRSPDLYLSYGMAKSGSTLAFELVRAMLDQHGIDQSPLPPTVTNATDGSNFIRTLDKGALQAAHQAVASRTCPLVIKTHSKLHPMVARQLKNGRLVGHAVCRDPRDIALSMLDAAREGRAWGSSRNGTFRCLEDTLPVIRKQVEHFLAWARCPGILVLHYEQVAFQTQETIDQLAGQLQLVVDPGRIIRTVTKERFTQQNRGISQRWKSEMSAADAAKIGIEFDSFIRKFCSDLPASPTTIPCRKPASLAGRIRRILRPGKK